MGGIFGLGDIVKDAVTGANAIGDAVKSVVEPSQEEALKQAAAVRQQMTTDRLECGAYNPSPDADIRNDAPDVRDCIIRKENARNGR